MTRVNPQLRSKIQDLYASGERFTDLKKQFNLGSTTIYRVIKGIKQNLNGKRDIRCSLTIDQEYVCCELYLSGFTCARIAEVYGCNEATVRYVLSKLGITMRNTGPVTMTERNRKIISESSKNLWRNRRDHMLTQIRKIGFKRSRPRLLTKINPVDLKSLREKVLLRDGRRCTECGAVERLHVHHIKSINSRPDLALRTANCKTLCNRCHAREECRRQIRP